TEIRVLDTYWSDHCRHTTFSTELKNVTFDDGYYREPIEAAFRRYLEDRLDVYGDRKDKFVCLMDLATMGARKLKKEGLLEDQEETDEINACSIVVPVEIDGKTEEWLINFKNETHNHPTEIEPFGGAATCLGGAIRDPLSGRTYVYQAMRVTGAADPRTSMADTLKGKLPQKKLVREAAHGYSSYGNQIGLATGYVKEIYHPAYVAKRMEIGAVMAAAPRKNVIRETSRPGDVIILLGGRTGRDGIGGATGSSKAHTASSIEVCGAEVQKGNAPTERKLQRMFRRPEVSKLIRKCNDFGAGGVSVAIGELAEGLQIDLDKVPKKYAGLDGTELAISESQERMACVIAPEDVEQFLEYAAQENLEAVKVAVVTSSGRLVMNWRGHTIVDISRAFLDTNGAHQETDVEIEMPSHENRYFEKKPLEEDRVYDCWTGRLKDLNGCSQKGLVEMFDSSIGAGSVLMPYGGKYQLTETQAMVAKLPMDSGKCDTVTMMAYGFDPYLSSWSPYHGAIYAVLESVARITASGGDWSKIRFTFQEYFRRMSEDPKRWSQPAASLLGAYTAQIGLGLPSIGGKDSMSGSFDDIDVPPTLVSFAVDVNTAGNIISPELKRAGSKLVLVQIEKDQYDVPDFEDVKRQYSAFFEDVKAGRILSACAVDAQGFAAALSRMAFGNRLGFRIEHNVAPEDLFFPDFGAIICEVKDGEVGSLHTRYTVVGVVEDTERFEYRSTSMSIDEALEAWTGTLEKTFRSVPAGQPDQTASAPADVEPFDVRKAGSVYVCGHKIAQPKVFIPVFPGTNCEYDSAKAFERAGARTDVRVFRNLSSDDIRASVDEFASAIDDAQIIMFPGGFSAGDEPDGSAKFFATAFRNAKISESVERLLSERDGLILGICNGFQALIKLGLVPEGKIAPVTENSPTLTFNTIHRHISRMVCTKVMTNKSPWLAGADLGGVYVNAASHGEGRFVADESWIRKLIENGQVATMYCDPDGMITADPRWNVNGSYACIEGITSPDGRILGKMAHIERRGEGVAVNITGEQDMKVFESGVRYFS
ncbi:MAG: phosphoribosylformylglycinamidine synthase, partial [Lachnospiraceae bacterium]|nr:phosphoribosylformylglycinamidine synthase [Lachnospiraceae bacterium]